MADDHRHESAPPTTDPRVSAARYRTERLERELRAEGESPNDPEPAAPPADEARTDASPVAPTAHERALYVETVLQQAFRRGDFDNLPGAGKPLEGLGASDDPDWWIRRKIKAEQLTGLGPPALRLRVEHAGFDDHVDGLTREDDVREYTEDFTRRVIEARRQLQGGPPVVTPTRDPDAEVSAWHARRAARLAAAAEEPPPAPPRRPWWRRR
ncbi:MULTISPECIES: DnaJ family domain-containing protein [unclassified Microbacterium]|uniref:DnaJ family domain-containing protein n=1 Tax=unclassified Microbacterium TaxID=2609290 RepID=UPI00386C5F54